MSATPKAKGYSANPLSEKTRLKPGMNVYMNHPPADYVLLINDCYDQLIFRKETDHRSR